MKLQRPLTSSRVALALLTLGCALAVGCRPDTQRTESVDVEAGERERAGLPEPVVAQLDSGSLAYRADDYEAALDHYRRAAELAPEFAAAWFGVYMAHKALGNEASADSALARVQSLAPGATLLHPSDTSDGEA